MPDFCRAYFIGRENRLSEITAFSYASNLHMFFDFLHRNNGYFGNRDIRDYTLDDMEILTTEDIEEFLHWLRYHEIDGVVYRNSQNTLNHYISAISSLYSYYIKRRHLTFNPVDAIDRSKIKKKRSYGSKTMKKSVFWVQRSTGPG